MTLLQLTYALEVARCSSFNKAADKLFTHQSNISNSISALESDIGIKLFDRTQRGVTVTDAGREFLSYAEEIVNKMSFVEDLYAVRRTVYTQSLQISTMRAFYLSSPISGMKDAFVNNAQNGIYLRLKKRSFNDVINDVSEGLSDVGTIFMPLSQTRRVERLSSAKELEYFELGRTSICLIMRKGHPALEGDVLESITNYPYMISEEVENFRLFYDQQTKALSRLFSNPPHVMISLNESTAMQEIVAKTDAFFLSCAPSAHSEFYDFVSVPLQNPQDEDYDPLVHYMITRRNAQLSPVAAQFTKALISYFSEQWK